jgi:hypothetical protein
MLSDSTQTNVSSHKLLDLLDSFHGMPCWVHQETRVGTSQFLTAVECAGTHFGWQALFKIEMSQPSRDKRKYAY